MLGEIEPRSEQFTVVRLSAVSDDHVKRLLNRGICPENFPEIQDRLKRNNIVIELSQLIDKVFEPSSNPKHSTPFNRSRFTDGHEAVFYSALEDETSIEETKPLPAKAGRFD
jgi:hypothetical protein